MTTSTPDALPYGADRWNLVILDGEHVGEPGRSMWAMIDPTDASVREIITCVGEGPDDDELLHLVVSAIAEPRPPAHPARPHTLHIPGGLHAKRQRALRPEQRAMLMWTLRSLGVQLQTNDEVRDLRAMTELIQSLGAQQAAGAYTGAPFHEARLCALAWELHRRAPWERLEDHEIIMLHAQRAHVSHPIVTFRFDPSPGLVLYRTLDDARRLYTDAHQRDEGDSAFVFDFDLLGLFFDQLDHIDPGSIAALRRAGLITDHSDLLPSFAHIQPDVPRRTLGRRSAESFAVALEALVRFFDDHDPIVDERFVHRRASYTLDGFEGPLTVDVETRPDLVLPSGDAEPTALSGARAEPTSAEGSTTQPQPAVIAQAHTDG